MRRHPQRRGSCRATPSPSFTDLPYSSYRLLPTRPDRRRTAATPIPDVERLEARVLCSATLVGGSPSGGVPSVGGDTTAPTAMVDTTQQPANMGAPSYVFTVSYNDDVAVKATTLGSDDVLVTGPNNFQQVAKYVGPAQMDGPFLRASYQIDAPSGMLVATDAGTYLVQMQAFGPGGGVGDTSGNGVAAGMIGSFNLQFGPAGPDTQPPSAVLDPNEPPGALGASGYTFGIGYNDNVAVAASTLGSDDILVTGPNNFSQVAHYVGQAMPNGSFVHGVYQVDAPGGSFGPANDGVYTFTMMGFDPQMGVGGVTDTSNNGVPAGVIGSLTLNFDNPPSGPTGPDTNPPKGMVEANQPPASLGAPGYVFTVDYTDDVAVSATTLGNDDVVVTGPNGFGQTARYVGQSVPDGTFVRAAYMITPPGGLVATSAGRYTVTMLAYDQRTNTGGVTDTSHNGVPAVGIGAFDLQFGTTPTPTGPQSQLVLNNVFYAPGQYAPGGSIVFRGTATNRGNTDPGPVELEVRLSPTPQFGDDDDVKIGVATIAQSLPPGASVAARLPMTVIPADTEPGTYFLGARVVPVGTDGGVADQANIFISQTPNVVVGMPVQPPSPPPAPGGLNPNFGDGGVVRRRTGLLTTTAVATQLDGKAVAVGEADGPGGRDFGITRFNTDGTLDTTFGGPGTGAFFTDFAGNRDVPAGVKIQPDGKFLVLGTSTNPNDEADSDIVLARYMPDGTPDFSFGLNGRALTDFSADPQIDSADIAQDLLLLPDGRIVVSGRSDAGDTGTDFALARYLPNGAPDTSFGTGGKVLTDFSGGDDAANALALDPKTGQILVAGSAPNPASGTTAFALARYNADGRLDSGFGAGGKVLTTVKGQDDEAFGLGISSKGQIVAVGGAFSTTGGVSTSDIAVVRYTTKGVPDKSFGANGIVTTSLGQPAVGNQVQISDSGGLLVAGATAASLESLDPSHIDVGLASYTATGTLDTTFGTGGKTVLNLGTSTGTSSPSSPSDPSPAPVGAPSQAQLALAILATQKAITTALGGKLTIIATNGSDTVAAQVVSNGSDLSSAIAVSLPSAVVGGAKGSATVTVTDSGNEPASGTVTITLYASLDQSADSSDMALGTITGKKIKLKAGSSKAFKTKFSIPKALTDGNYYLLAKTDGGSMVELSDDNNTAATTTTVTVAAPFADLSGPALTTPSDLAAGGTATIPVTVKNVGNIPTKGTFDLKLVAAAAPTPADDDVTLATLSAVKVSLKAGASKTFQVKAQVPSTLAAGTYYLLAVLTPSLSPTDSDSTNDVLAGDATLTLS